MKLSFALLAAAATGAAAFAPASQKASTSTAIRSEPLDAEVSMPPSLGPTINGWTPDASKPCYGLPGAIAPLGALLL